MVIEKEGIADIVAAYAHRYCVALVHTQGRLTEYGKDLIEESSSPVVILTDYDAYGMQIAEATINKIPRIGIVCAPLMAMEQRY